MDKVSTKSQKSYISVNILHVGTLEMKDIFPIYDNKELYQVSALRYSCHIILHHITLITYMLNILICLKHSILLLSDSFSATGETLVS